MANLTKTLDKPTDLNDSQWRAVRYSDGHLLIVAGPGTGKTHTLTHRIASLSRQLKPDQQALAITFTHKAAQELKERLIKTFPQIQSKIFVGTFHSFCLSYLRQHGENTDLPPGLNIATAYDLERVAKQLWPGQSKRDLKKNLDAITHHKSRQLCHGLDAPDGLLAYNQALRANGLLDYDDLLLETGRLLSCATQTGFSHVFVDEYQDINALQHALLKEFVRCGATLTAIGDPHQAIYSFRGADVSFFERFSKDFPNATVLSLSDNYRCAPNILKASGQIVAREVPLVSAATIDIYQQGQLTVYDAPTDKAEAEYVVHQIEKIVGGTSMFSKDSGRVSENQWPQKSFKDIAVLYRLNAQKIPLEESLSRHGIPYAASDERPFVELSPVLELTAFLRLLCHQTVSIEAVSRLLNLSIRGSEDCLKPIKQGCINLEDLRAVPDKKLGPLIQDLESLKGLTHDLTLITEKLAQVSALKAIFDDHRPTWKKNIDRFLRMSKRFSSVGEFLDFLCLQQPEDAVERRAENVHLMTLHAAKGLEFPVVFIVGCEQNLLPLSISGMVCNPDEERRLFYVGMTRAKEVLFLTHARRRRLFGQLLSSSPSVYLNDIDQQLKEYDQAQPARRRKDKPGSAQFELFKAS